jgi:hypothetical protein
MNFFLFDEIHDLDLIKNLTWIPEFTKFILESNCTVISIADGTPVDNEFVRRMALLCQFQDLPAHFFLICL